MSRFVCIHAHFYQPPRENPWLEEVEVQDSAYPYHDWNERVTAECYAPNGASRILDGDGWIAEIVNNYEKISFNFGPTLLSWLERRRPDAYAAVLEADRASCARFSGHGSALAQVYSHAILPLANRRDKQTQILWGLKDFERRFRRAPEGMWLAETGVDLESLDLLAEFGVRFTVLAPHQARRVRGAEAGEWRDAADGIDPRVPYLCRLPSGRTIALFFYDGPISRDIAFGGLLADGHAFARRLAEAFLPGEQPQLVHVATDGETYGHHHRRGDMALASCLHHLEEEGLARLTVYGEHLERFPPRHEAELHEGSSWSCVHGVERWRDDCGCNSGTKPGWRQGWRRPLREAMDWLRDTLAPAYEEQGRALLKDPWAARDEYIDVILDRGDDALGAFLGRHARRGLSADQKVQALKLLELQRHAVLMYTSCGWFFDEVSGIETVQVMQYAGRALQIARDACGVDLEAGYVERLRRAPSNVPEVGTAATVFERYVKPAELDVLRVGSHYAVSSLFEDYPEQAAIYSYSAQRQVYQRQEAGRQRLAVGRVRIRSEVTREGGDVSFAVLHLGDHNVVGGVRVFLGDDPFTTMVAEVSEPFGRSDVPEVIRVIDRHFGDHTYSLWHLFRDEQRKALDQIRSTTLAEVETALRQIHHNNYSMMNFLRGLSAPLPKALLVAAEYTVGADLVGLFRRETVDVDRLTSLVEEAERFSLDVDWATVAFVAAGWLTQQLEVWARDPKDRARLEEIDRVLTCLGAAPFELDLWKAQNVYVAAMQRLRASVVEAAGADDERSRNGLEGFEHLGEHLRVRVVL